MIKKIILAFFSIAFLLFLTVGVSEAATLYLVSKSSNYQIGDEFEVEVKVESEEDSINATQATISFPSDILEVVGVDKSNSTFNFWVQEPSFSNEDGKIVFIGGTSKGVTGSSLHIVKIKFKAKGTGEAELSLSDSVITANDGKGTNILSDIENLAIGVGVRTTISTPPVSEVVEKEEVVVPKPQVVERPAVTASELPGAPEISVPFYPDPEKWYNYITWDNKGGETNALWEVPDDVISFAFQVDQNPNSVPTKAEEKLYNGKSFYVFDEGISYVHVRFKNNLGWGPTAHYRIAIDTTAPLSFEAKMDPLITDNPSPVISFEAKDILSGISHALLIVDGKEGVRVEGEEVLLPLQEPGVHNLVVRIFDRAGNSVEDDLQFEILPLDTPTLTFLTKSVSQGEVIFLSGHSVPGYYIETIIRDGERQVFSGITEVNELGSFEVTIDKSLPLGKYQLVIKARDSRGAVSFETEPESLNIRAKTILSLGFIDLTWFEITIFIILVVLIVAGILWWLYFEKEKTKGAYQSIAVRDVNKMADLMDSDLNQLRAWHTKEQGVNEQAKGEANFFLDKLSKQVANMKKYIADEINKIN